MSRPRARSRGDPTRAPERPRWRIDEVLARTDLANLLDRFTERATYTHRGAQWHCPVPGHEDRRASVTMNVDYRGHERWRCWSGPDNHRGDAIDLVMVTQNVDRRDAIDWLARDVGLTPAQPLPPPVQRKIPPRPSVVPLDPAVPRYVQACERILDTPHGAPVREWLAGRGLDPDVCRANHVGGDPGRQLMHRQRGLPYGGSVAATFPVLNPAGQIRYVQTRYLEPGDGPKYDNPAAALGTNPRLAWTNPVALPTPGVLVVCEGIPDALTAAQAGYHAVAVLGSQSPDDTVAARLAYRAEHQDLHLIAVIDADPEGRRWGQRLGDLLVDHDQDLTIIEPPEEGLDLNSWSQQDPAWRRQLTVGSPELSIADLTPPSEPTTATVELS